MSEASIELGMKKNKIKMVYYALNDTIRALGS